MSERELLELAALAAGYEYTLIQKVVETIYGVKSCPVIVINGNDWNPREDDGDCARLETKCEMLVSVDKDCARAGSYINGYGIECSEQYANHAGDRNKARRFASVRCAAEIGRRMKERNG